MTAARHNIVVGAYGRPLSNELRQWQACQDDLLVSLLANETASQAMQLSRLAKMISDNQDLIRSPAQARAALIGALIANGAAAANAIGRAADTIDQPPSDGLLQLVALLSPMALQCDDGDLPDIPPAGLVPACLIANDPALLKNALAREGATTWAINDLPLVHYAAITGKAACLGVLLEKGFDPNELDHEGNTALHNASTPAIVRTLLAAGVDPAKANQAGHLPAQAWSGRTHDLAAQEAMLAILLQSPDSTPDPVESFFALAQSNNMGRLKSFARKLGVDYSIRHAGQGLVFNAAVRLGREALSLTDMSPTTPNEVRAAANWLKFLASQKQATQAMTPIERQAVTALVGALSPSVRPNFPLAGPSTNEPGDLRHLGLSLARSLAPKSPRQGGALNVRLPIQDLFIGAFSQALDANDALSASDATYLATTAFRYIASSRLHEHIAPMLATRLHVPPADCDNLLLAACKSLRDFTRNSPANDTAGFGALATIASSLQGPLPQSEKYIREWSQSLFQAEREKRQALEPLLALVQAAHMNRSTPQAELSPVRTAPRF